MQIEAMYETIGVQLTPVGSRWKGLCPFHLERFPSFYVFEDGGYHCFGCGAHGTVQSILDKMHSEHKFLAPLRNTDGKTAKAVYCIFSDCSKKINKISNRIPFKVLCMVYDKLDMCQMQAAYNTDDPEVSSLSIIRFSKKTCARILKIASWYA
jgi:hypothetical protein